MTIIDTFKHLNDDSKLVVEIDLPELARRVCAMNYGAHRLLSAMVHELRRSQKDFEDDYAARHPDWPRCPDTGSPLADGLETLLNQGHTD